MIIDLSSLGGGSKKFDLMLAPEEVDPENTNVSINGDVSVRGEVTRHIAETEVNGTIAFAAEVDCTRCLKPVPQSLLFNFEASYVAPEDFSDEREKEVSAADLGTDVLADNSLDLTALVREQILLNLPEQVLCVDECKGLCPKCGQDRNLVDCKCQEDETDPRWSALKNLR